jgi:hypothetical protein
MERSDSTVVPLVTLVHASGPSLSRFTARIGMPLLTMQG